MTARALQRLEANRQQEQDRLDSLKSSLERNRLGQFATPYELASHIAELAASKWTNRSDKIEFLDPAFGSGVFYSTLIGAIPRSRIESARGIEIDPEFSRVASELWTQAGLEAIEADFTQLSFPSPGSLANLIICNPPYIRHHHLDRDKKRAMKKRVSDATGLSINGLAGMYCYYVLLAHGWLKPEGIGIWLIPTEFMDVNYGSVLRSYLTKQVTLSSIHRFETTDVQFTDALVSSAVVVFENTPPPPQNEATFSFGGKLSEPREVYKVGIDWLSKHNKWTRKPALAQQSPKSTRREILFGDLFRTRRGLATGANAFFILSRQEAEERGLPEEFLKPILPSPRHLTNGIIEADGEGFPLLDPQLVLIDCDLPERRVRDEYPELWTYLEHGKELNFHQRYLARKRTPWYRQEKLAYAPFLCSYMGRSQGIQGPFRFFWNKSRATVPNVYHLITPRDHMAALLVKDAEFQADIFRLLNEIALDEMILEGRTYGGGLHKIEPKELLRLRLTNIALAKDIAAESMMV